MDFFALFGSQLFRVISNLVKGGSRVIQVIKVLINTKEGKEGRS